MGIEKVKRPPHPLSILHIILYTVGCALAYSIFRFVSSFSDKHEISTFELLHISFLGLVVGFAFASLLMAPVAWYLKAPYPRDPGHWLLMVHGIAAILFRGLFIGILLFFRPHDGGDGADWLDLTHWFRVWQMCHLLALMFYSTLFLTGAILSPGGVHWRIIWAVFFARFVIEILYGSVCLLELIIFRSSNLENLLMYPWATAPQMVMIPVIMSGALVDLLQKRERDWLHWLGLVVVVLLILADVVFPVIHFYFIRQPVP